MKKNERYFNFPIRLLSGFLENDREVLDNIFDYALYSHSVMYYDKGTAIKRIKDAESYFFVTCGNREHTLNNGKKLYENTPSRSVMVGINTSLWFDYYKNEKTEFEKVCLLGYLSLKSILGSKGFCKTGNLYFLSRMDGKSKSVKYLWDFSSSILKYNTEYQINKIKKELIHNWNLVYYSRYTRGFYFSFSLSLEALVLEAEKRRKSNKEKQRKKDLEKARKKALEYLQGTRP